MKSLKVLLSAYVSSTESTYIYIYYKYIPKYDDIIVERKLAEVELALEYSPPLLGHFRPRGMERPGEGPRLPY